MDPGQLLSRRHRPHGSGRDPPAHTREGSDGVFISLQAVPPHSLLTPSVWPGSAASSRPLPFPVAAPHRVSCFRRAGFAAVPARPPAGMRPLNP